MKFDIFFSICQTEVAGLLPDEATMFRNFFEQVEAADELGFDCAWIAETHLSTEVQKSNRRPVVPDFKGEIGLNVDIFQLSQQVFRRTSRIECGSAVMNILCNGGPIAAAERIAAFCSLHGLDPEERRRIRIGFSAGRFEFMNRAYGIDHRDRLEEAAWPAYRGQIFREACDIFLRLLRGDVLNSNQTVVTSLGRSDFRDDQTWDRVRAAYRDLHDAEPPDQIPFPKRFEFEDLKIVPADWRRDLLDLIVGSHDPALQVELNQVLPVKVFNLSITSRQVIEETHRRMRSAYHPDGGDWHREYMPRTVMVFLNAEQGLTATRQSAAATEEAHAALSEYWNALEGTIDPKKLKGATKNALVGNPEEIAEQITARFHPEDRLMLWFDFYNHDSRRVIRNMEAFQNVVAPRLETRA